MWTGKNYAGRSGAELQPGKDKLPLFGTWKSKLNLQPSKNQRRKRDKNTN